MKSHINVVIVKKFFKHFGALQSHVLKKHPEYKDGNDPKVEELFSYFANKTN